jgi:DNA-binding ferritin-like protein (Dps family)
MGIQDFTTRIIGDKRRWRAYRARAEQLPTPYRTAITGVERYIMHTGPTDGDALLTMLDDLAELFEQSAAAGTPIRDVVGVDPVEFAEEFKRNYGIGSWIGKEQQRLLASVDEAEQAEQQERSS